MRYRCVVEEGAVAKKCLYDVAPGRNALWHSTDLCVTAGNSRRGMFRSSPQRISLAILAAYSESLP